MSKKCDVFTPLNIVERMTNYLHKSATLLKCLDTRRYNIDVYETRYAFGRKQGINIMDKKVYTLRQWFL